MWFLSKTNKNCWKRWKKDSSQFEIWEDSSKVSWNWDLSTPSSLYCLEQGQTSSTKTTKKSLFRGSKDSSISWIPWLQNNLTGTLLSRKKADSRGWPRDQVLGLKKLKFYLKNIKNSRASLPKSVKPIWERIWVAKTIWWETPIKSWENFSLW